MMAIRHLAPNPHNSASSLLSPPFGSELSRPHLLLVIVTPTLRVREGRPQGISRRPFPRVDRLGGAAVTLGGARTCGSVGFSRETVVSDFLSLSIPNPLSRVGSNWFWASRSTWLKNNFFQPGDKFAVGFSICIFYADIGCAQPSVDSL